LPEEQIEKLRLSHLGKKLSETTRQKMRESMARRKEKLGYTNSPETREKIRLANLGKPGTRRGAKTSEETKRKQSEAARRRKPEQTSRWKGGISGLPGYKSWHKAKRRAQMAMAGGSFTVGEWENLKKQFNHTCPLCGKSEPEIVLTIDHIIPLSRGGSNWIENIQPLCLSCNCRKNKKAFKINKTGQFEMILGV